MRRIIASIAAVIALAALVVVGGASLAGAAVYSNGSGTTTITASAREVSGVTISANPLDFGQNLGVLSTDDNVNTTISVTASATTPYNVGINAGSGIGSSGTTRYLSGTGANTSTIAFNLFQASGNTPWGNTQGTNTQSGTGSGSAQILTVYGQIPAQTTPQQDTYTSVLTVTVYF
jgi:spore coat protein U-like protein